MGNSVNSCWKSEAEQRQEVFVNQAADVATQLGASTETKDAVTAGAKSLAEGITAGAEAVTAGVSSGAETTQKFVGDVSKEAKQLKGRVGGS